MSTTTETTTTSVRAPLQSETRLPSYHLLFTAAAALVLAAVILLLFNALSLFSLVLVGFLLHLGLAWIYSTVREGPRWAKDRVMTLVIYGAFAVTMFPLLSLLWEVLRNGTGKIFTPGYLTTDMLGVIGGMDSGGIGHAIVGTLLVTLGATVISVPIGFLTSIFLVEYTSTKAMRALGKGVTFLVDVMTGIPSIVAGLFGVALFVTITNNPGIEMGLMGSVALSVLMIPTVVRSSEEMLRLVPLELREASYALGVPKWLTIINVVLRTAIAGLATSVTLAIARVIGETAPLLLTIGSIPMFNSNLFEGSMMTLPTFINGQYSAGYAPCNTEVITNPITKVEHACNPMVHYENAWAAALALIIIVMVLNVFARIISYYFAPKLGR